jgi:replicative DNA helicase
LETGLIDFDRVVGFMRPQNMVVVGARPGTGKTALAITIAANICRRGGRVLIFSLEMSAEQLLQRMACAAAGVAYSVFRDRMATRHQESKIEQAAKEIQGWELYIEDDSRTTGATIQSHSRSMHRKKPLDLVIVDYIQKVRPSERFNSKKEIVADASWRIVTTAKKLDIPILALAQLNRECEKDKRWPRMSDLGDAADIEHDAHVVGFLTKQTSKGEDLPDGEVHFLTGKNREWPLGDCPLTFIGNLTKFENYVRDTGI